MCEEETINTCSRGGKGGHQEPFHGPRGANEDLEEQVVFPVSQTKERSSFLKCLKKGKRKGLLLFLNTSLICWKMALKALNNLPAPGDRLRHTRQHPGESQGSWGPSLPQVSIESPLLHRTHHQPTSHLVWREKQNAEAIKKPVSYLLSNLYTHIPYLLTHLIITNFFRRQWIS